jgi:hypothetical protein
MTTSIGTGQAWPARDSWFSLSKIAFIFLLRKRDLHQIPHINITTPSGYAAKISRRSLDVKIEAKRRGEQVMFGRSLMNRGA